MHLMTEATRRLTHALTPLLVVAVMTAAGTAIAGESDPPAYVIAQENVVNAKALNRYRKAAAPSLREHGGKLIAAAKRVQVLEGKWPGNETVVLEFPSLAEAKKWYLSQSYQKAIRIRKGATSFSNIVIVEGVESAHSVGAGNSSH